MNKRARPAARLLLANLGLAALLVLLSQLGWHGLPVAPLFVAGGVGVAAVARGGFGLLPAVALAAGWSVHMLDWPLLVLVCGSALLQAAAGGWAMARWGAGGGCWWLVAALAATLSSLLMPASALLQPLALGALWPGWPLWWGMDLLGMALGAPLAAMLFGQGPTGWRARLLLGVPLLAAALATGPACRQLALQEQERQRELFQLRAKQVGDLLQFQFDEHGRFLFAVGKAIDATSIGSSAQFSRLARGYLEHRPELRLISLARRVPRAARTSFEAWGAAALGPSFTIRTVSGQPAPAEGAYPDFFATTYLEPFKGNEAVLGVDLLSEPVRARMVERAVERHLAAASAPLTLLQGGQRQVAILLAQEIRAADADTYGVLVAVIEIAPYIRRTIESTDFANHPIRLEDTTEARPQLLYDEMKGRDVSDDYQRPLALGGRNYLLTISDPASASAQPGGQTLALLAAATLVGVLMSALLMLLTAPRPR